MENFNPEVLEEYLKIKKVIETFRKIQGNKNSNLIIDAEQMKKNIRKSLVVKELEDDHFSRTM